MPTYRRQRFIHALTAWMLAVVLLLVLVDALAYELVFVLSLIGLLIITELTAPIHITPQWRRRLFILIGLGLLVFGLIVVRRILEILPPEVLPW